MYFGDDDLGDRLGYSIGTKRKENIGGDYTKLNIDWHTGITLGAAQAYGGVRFFDNSVGYYNSTTKLFSVGEGSSDVKVYNDLNVVSNIEINGTTVIDASRNLTNVNLVKFRENAASFYISPTNPNTLNAQYGTTADTADMWINYRGYADGFTKFRDFRIGNGKGAALLHVDGSASTFDFQSGSTLKMNGTTFIDANRNITVGNITSSGTFSVGSYFKAGTSVAAGFYQDSLNGGI